MNLNFAKLFPSKTGDAVPLKIRAKRSIHLTNSEGKAVHVEAGDDVEITRAVFSQLDQDDVQVLTGSRDDSPVADPTPPRREVEPMPGEWKPLPECFAAYWQIQEEFRVARLHIEEIRQCRVDTFGSNVSLFANPEAHSVLVNRIDDWKPRENLVYHSSTVDLTDPKNQKLERYIVAAENGAVDYLDRLKEARALPMQRAFLECGFHRVGISEKLAAIITELDEIGFALFSARIAALGLAEGHARRLYAGSADFVRFSHQAPAYTGGNCFGGMAEDGSMRVYSDDPVFASASHSLSQSARIKDLEQLLVKGRAELAAARKVTAKAA